MEFTKISRAAFLNALNGKSVALLQGGYYSINLQQAIDILKSNAGGLYLRTAINTGVFKKRSNGYIRDDSYCTFKSGAEVYHDGNRLYLIFTPAYTYDADGNAATKNNLILLRAEV